MIQILIETRLCHKHRINTWIVILFSCPLAISKLKTWTVKTRRIKSTFQYFLAQIIHLFKLLHFPQLRMKFRSWCLAFFLAFIPCLIFFRSLEASFRIEVVTIDVGTGNECLSPGNHFQYLQCPSNEHKRVWIEVACSSKLSFVFFLERATRIIDLRFVGRRLNRDWESYPTWNHSTFEFFLLCH